MGVLPLLKKQIRKMATFGQLNLQLCNDDFTRECVQLLGGFPCGEKKNGWCDNISTDTKMR